VTIVWSARAVRHLAQLRSFIARDRPSAAREVAVTILSSVNLLAEQPSLGRPGRLPGTRELVVSRTPYLVPYRVRGNRLEVIAVFHGRQRWPDKL
jgi:toxin ParE1/3/4